MNWRNLVSKNMLRNLRRYLGYLLAATLAVTVFAMFTAFIDNPAVQHGHVTQTASELLLIFRVLVALFAIFFVFYFHAALIRARNKEFGLLLTLGVTPGQIGRLIFYESIVMGLVTLLIGIGLGILCSYFFQLAMVAILALPEALPFTVPLTTFTSTGIFFGIVFLLEACWISLRVTRRTPRVLLLGARVQQKPPRTSWLLVLLGLLCIGAAYDMALQFSTSIIFTMFPIIGLTIIGTYLLFSQCSVMLLKRLRRPGIPGARLLIVARLAHRMRDYARMLTVVTVLNAIVLTGMGAVFGVLQVAELQQTLGDPFALQFSVNALHPSALTPSRIQQEIARQHFTLQTVIETPLVTGTGSAEGLKQPISLMAISSFTRLQQAELQAHPELGQYHQSNPSPLAGDDQAYLYVPDAKQPPTFQQLQIAVGGSTFTLRLVDEDNRGILNDWHGISEIGPATNVVVVTDALYTRLASNVALDRHWQVYSYVLPNWQESASIVKALRQQLPDEQQSLLTDTATSLDEIKQFLSVMLFGDFFISCLFFLAAGSALYFKLFNQQEEDRRQFRALERIGMQRHEAGRLLSREFLLLFFLPVALGIVHSIVALLDLANLFHDPSAAMVIGKAFAPICLVYLACFAAYFWISRVNYLRRMQFYAAVKTGRPALASHA